MQFVMPDKLETDNGDKRRVGFELEFANLELPVIADILCDNLSGKITKKQHAEILVDTESFGEFIVELDWELAKKVSSDKPKAEPLLDAEQIDRILDWATRAAGQVVPAEIVCPPIAIEQLHELNEIIADLRNAGAKGTEDALLYAFGVHINPELPDLKANTIIRFIQSYCLAQDWLLKVNNVDLSRRITPYINLYPKKYIKHILQYDGNEEMSVVIDDYLKFNPTRNRALDLLPLFKHVDEERVSQIIKDARVKSRPTFHYRMPNCEIEKSGWDLSKSWNIWCVIEHLAYSESLLADMVNDWQEHNKNIIKIQSPKWFQTLNQLHEDLLSE